MKFSGPKLNYNIHNKELLIIVDAFEECRAYYKDLMLGNLERPKQLFDRPKKIKRAQWGLRSNLETLWQFNG